ncbi:hypothetical protein KJ966_14245 [bacterium]|nr:hypothetical protein [bacterium]
MTETTWQKEECSPGRDYMLGRNPYVKYDDHEAIITTIVDGLRKFIHAEPAVRLTLDAENSDAERAILAIPFESDQESILLNFARIIYQSTMGYYISASPRTSHFGISNLLLEGNHNSLLRREMEKLIAQFQSRDDMAGRLIQNVTLVGKHAVPEPGETFLSETIRKGLDIHVGYRIHATGGNVNCSQIFLPIQTGSEIINQIYYNIERILHHSFVSYDENGESYLKITDTLIFKDLCELLKRSKTKELTRNKILNNLQFDTITKQESEEEKKLIIGDRLYDMLNHIQDTKLKEATDRSRDLYTASMKSMAGISRVRIEHPAVMQIQAKPTEAPAVAASATEAQSTGAPQATEARQAPARPFRRQARPDSGSSSRRKFQKIELTQDELAIGKVQVPEPPRENLRVPSPRKPRRITRIRPEEVAVPGKK